VSAENSAPSIYSSPLSERYASRAMLELWGPSMRYGLWRRLWLVLAEAQRELGLDLPEAAVNEMGGPHDQINI
jgi:adenylosuccinate lyase